MRVTVRPSSSSSKSRFVRRDEIDEVLIERFVVGERLTLRARLFRPVRYCARA